MKKLILATLVATSVFCAQAQTEQGGWVIGTTTNLTFSSTNIDGVDDNSSSFNLSGQAGYFLIDNLAAGLTLGLSSVKQGDFKTSSTNIGPFARYYVNGTFYAGAGYTVSSGKSESGSTTISEFDGGNLLLEAGYPIWIVDNVAIEPGISYTSGSGDIDRSTLAVAVGFRLYFQ